MRAGFHLSQEQNLSVLMTAELHQSLQVLQMPSYELAQYVQEQALENPILEIDAPLDYYRTNRIAKTAGTAGGGEPDPFRKVKASGDTLEQWLLSQLRLAGISDGLYKACAYLAGNLDERGYLTLSVAEASAFLKLPQASVEAALRLLQSLEPPGVGAGSLQECLLLQIERDPNAAPGAYEVVSRYWLQLTQLKLDKIAAGLGLTLAEVKQIAAYIRSLNPRPGGAFHSGEPAYVVPDADISILHGELVIRINPGACPKVSINRDYAAVIQNAGCPEAAQFLKEKRKTAGWLMNALEQRKSTLLRVIGAIFEEQTAFLEAGIRGIKPLNLKMVAEKLELHESTVSRAVQHKYIRTPYGVFELKYFFSTGLQTAHGELASAKTIKARIKELISQEDKSQPLSDQRLLELLTEEGIQIARRTVAKYREELQILSSALRKRML